MSAAPFAPPTVDAPHDIGASIRESVEHARWTLMYAVEEVMGRRNSGFDRDVERLAEQAIHALTGAAITLREVN